MSKKVSLIAVHKKTDDFQSATLKQYVITLPFSLVRMLSACLCSLTLHVWLRIETTTL